jgi:outer membrane protein
LQGHCHQGRIINDCKKRGGGPPGRLRAAQIALAGLQEEALTGTRTVLDVLVGELQLFTSQGQFVTAEHDAAIAEFNVAAAVGRLIALELRLPVRLYDMERHYKEVRDKRIGFADGLQQ